MSHISLRFRVPALVIILSAGQSAYATLVPVVISAINSATVQPITRGQKHRLPDDANYGRKPSR